VLRPVRIVHKLSTTLQENKPMKLGYVIGALAGVIAGAVGAWGVNEYLSIKSELKAVQQSAVAQTTSLDQPQTARPAQTTRLSTVALDFEDLPLCDQLDAIAKSGKSVAQFVANSGRYGEFAAQVTATCNWHSEQLATANSILNPPVVQSAVSQPASVEPVASSHQSAPRRPWNNCNGIREAGESYSAACHEAQIKNDTTWDVHDPIDQRRRNRITGELPSPNGYSAN
jgi:hypothetical protein